jgi:hypothetical protein
VSIFRRNKNQAAEGQPVDDALTPEDVSGDEVPGDGSEDLASRDLAAEDLAADDDAAGDVAAADAGSAQAPAGRGPFDASEVEDSSGRLDLGSLWIRGVAGMELRLEVEEETQNIVGATAVLGDSAVQLQAFAAPKTMGLWDDIRAEIAESIVGQGGTADEQRGVLGTELRTRMPSAGPDGRTVFAPARFVGVDGPRWFLRAVFSGRAAIEDDAAAELMDVVRQTVVVRGDAAMAPRDLLPLRLPPEVSDAQAEDEDGADGPARSADDLNPFERGPEITEVR